MAPIEHVIVLMLENRSFDHMLGFMTPLYPPGDFNGLAGTESNPDPQGAPVQVTADADGVIAVGPDHSHEGVMWQLTNKKPGAPTDPINNQGFVRAHAHVANGSGDDVMRCFAPDRVPVLSTLARQFAVCDAWFCSVPGETWPNRNYLHAATSDGEVNIEKRFFPNRTIFELLQAAGHEWAIYYRPPAQVWVFPELWQWPFSRRDRFRPLDSLAADIRAGQLPTYTFVEPDHGLLWPRKRSNSQHPSNNLEVPRDFYAGERLVFDVYAALYDTPAAFEKTVFLVTYDEHGGYYDHAVPPKGVAPAVPPDDKTKIFTFDLLGPRVPTVVVSPWVRAGTVDHTVLEHSAVPASLRSHFAPGLAPLTERDAVSQTFWGNLNLPKPRTQGELPGPDEMLSALDLAARGISGLDAGIDVQGDERPPQLDSFQESLIDLALKVDTALTLLPGGAAANLPDFVPSALEMRQLRVDPALRAAYLQALDQRFRAGIIEPPLPPLDDLAQGGAR